ncbi:hypothetical protein MMC11_004586 [Xylographa trunciseda]|nr:hypothetical protein [Xylographa trunciseda]
MGIDALSPVAPARIRCLLLPSGTIKRSRFLTFVERLQQESTVRLGDVSPNTKSQRNMFSPLAFPTGLAIYDMTTVSPSSSYLALAPFELYREPLVVIGIADGLSSFPEKDTAAAISLSADSDGTSNGRSNSGDFSETIGWLKDQYPRALVHQVFIFDCDGRVLSSSSDVILVPSLKNSKTTTMKTLMCDLTALLLIEMTSYAKSLQALPTIETPKSPQDQRASGDYTHNSNPQLDKDPRPESRISRTPTSRSSSPAANGERMYQRDSVPSQMYAAATDDTDERSTSRPPLNGYRTPPVALDQTNGASEAQQPSLDKERLRRLSRDRVALQGFGSGSVGERARNKANGRKGVVLGSLYLLAGRWPDALKELIEGATVARGLGDHVWHAKALDYILVCLLICAWAGMDFEIPQICYPLGDKTSPGLGKTPKHNSLNSIPDLTPLKSPNAANRLVSLQNLCNLLPDLANNILHLYVRAATFTADQLPQISYSESAIRFAKLLTIIENAHGSLDDQGLQLVVLNVDTNKRPTTIPSHLASFPTKAEVAGVLLKALPSSATESSLDMNDRVNILAGIASVLAKLGYHRKKAFIMRELVIILLPALIQSRKDSAAELGVHPAASLSSHELIGNVKEFEEASRPQQGSVVGIQSFLSLMCEVYGVVFSAKAEKLLHTHVSAETHHKDPDGNSIMRLDSLDLIVGCIIEDASTRSFGDSSLKVDVLRLCINICEALPDIPGILRFSSDLLKTAASGIAPGPESRDGSPALPMEDQARLLSNISRTVGAARKFSIGNSDAEYWDDFLVRGIEITRTSTLKSPSPRKRTHLDNGATFGSDTKDGPFIYNPFGTKSGSTAIEPLLVVGEEATFSILCQNLFDFDLDIEWIRLDTIDGSVDSSANNLMIGPYRTQSFQLVGAPKLSGVLRIVGCLVKVKGCRERRFPIFRSSWKGITEAKFKHLGLSTAVVIDERSESSVSEAARPRREITTRGPVTATLDVKVIGPQPNVVVQKTSLSQSAMMLLEGETKRFTMTLRNISYNTPVDILSLSFTDSATSTLQHALTNKGLSPSELYEVELVSYQKETLKWLHEDCNREVKIAPNENLSLEIEVVGKPGLTYGSIYIDYGYLGVDKAEAMNEFFTRQISFPFTITVNPSINLVRNDFLPFTGDFAWLNQKKNLGSGESARNTPPDRRSRATSRLTPKPENRFQSLLERLGLGAHGSDHFLLLLDFHNSWPKPLSISVQVREKTTVQEPIPTDLWKRAYTAHEVLQPDQTSRLVLLLPRIFLANPYAPIPSLNPTTKRQFIHSSSTAFDNETERSAREAFWLREDILKLMRASWTEDATGRTGQIELRTLRLTARMVDAIKLEDVGIDLTIKADSMFETDPEMASPVTQLARSVFHVPVDAFLTLNATVTNRLQTPIYPLLRLQPSLRNQPYNVALDLGRKFAFNGLLQQALPLLQPGESTEVQLGVVFLAGGEFEIRASIEEVRIWKDPTVGKANGGADDAADLGMSRLLDRIERRAWQSREPCIVHAIGDA